MDSLKTSLQRFYRKKLSAELTEYTIKKKFRALKWVPTVGITFTLVPFMSYSTADLLNALNTSQAFKAKKESIERLNEVQYNSDLMQISIMRKNLVKRIIHYNLTLDVLDLERQKFEIFEKSFNDNKITPSDYLNKKIQFVELTNELRNKQLDIENYKASILITSKHGFWETLK